MTTRLFTPKKSLFLLCCLALGFLAAGVGEAKPGKGKGGGGGGGGGGGEPPADPAIAFTSARELSVINADGSNLTSLVSEGGPGLPPSWSPDATMIAFTHQQGISAVRLSDRAVTPLALDDETHYASYPAWSPGGGGIAYLWYAKTHSETDPDEIRAVFADGSDQLLFQFDPQWIVFGGLSWSPDGTRLSAIVWDTELDDTFVAVVDLLFETVETATPEFYYVTYDSCSWARTGDRLAFVGIQTAGADEALWIVDLNEPLDSPDRRAKVFTPARENDSLLAPAWSPDDAQIAFGLRSTRKNTGVWTVNLATGGAQLLRKTPWVPLVDWKR